MPAQVPEATVWYGPDTYMGANLAQLLQWLAQMPDEEVCHSFELYFLLLFFMGLHRAPTWNACLLC